VKSRKNRYDQLGDLLYWNSGRDFGEQLSLRDKVTDQAVICTIAAGLRSVVGAMRF
jgi:hypothetical protein